MFKINESSKKKKKKKMKEKSKNKRKILVLLGFHNVSNGCHDDLLKNECANPQDLFKVGGAYVCT